MRGTIAMETLAAMQQTLDRLSLDLWEHPEPAFTEEYAAERLKAFLLENGFEMEAPVAGLKTAFVARWGSGSPKIGILAEYDALPGFSQKTQTTEAPVLPGGAGHACGHNLMGAAHAGAAIAVKRELEAQNRSGTVVFYGCPAEEVLTGKVFMARAGVFSELDCALNFHPNSVNGVNMHKLAAINNVKFNFTGKISHAAARPYDGRSATDAAELMNVGANYLREHIRDNIRIHYVTTDGGRAPNIVANHAQTWYYIRAKERHAVDEVYQRLIKVAQGAAMMTETTVEVDFQGGCYPTLQNKVLAQTIDAAMREIGPPAYTAEELAYADELNKTCPQFPVRDHEVDKSSPLSGALLGLYGEENFAYNASDIGDVSYLVPTTMFGTTCYNLLADLHSWQVAACTGHSIGRKGMFFAAQVLALTSLMLIDQPELLAQAKAEWKEALRGKTYICPIPPEVMPPA